jgi:hypothetical protein
MWYEARMRTIPLTKGQVAIVDDEDYERLSKHKWRSNFSKNTNSCYAIRHSPMVNGTRHTVPMHREVMNANPGETIDHINHNTLDQRKENLRVCTVQQNQANRKMISTNTSGYKGVVWQRRHKKWRAQIRFNGKLIGLGYYDTALDAALTYDRAAVEYHGEFALTNRMLGLLPE